MGAKGEGEDQEGEEAAEGGLELHFTSKKSHTAYARAHTDPFW